MVAEEIKKKSARDKLQGDLNQEKMCPFLFRLIDRCSAKYRYPPIFFFKRFFSSALHITVTFVYYLPLFPLIKGLRVRTHVISITKSS